MLNPARKVLNQAPPQATVSLQATVPITKVPPMPLPLRPLGRLIANGVGRQYLNPNIAEHLTFLDAELSRHPWFAGPDFSAADVMMSFPLQAAAGAGGLADYPRLAAFVSRIEARPAYERALERGGPFHLPGAS